MVETVETYDGWYALHDFRSIDWEKWQSLNAGQQKNALDEIDQLLAKSQEVADHGHGSHQIYSVVGQKADILFMVLRPEMKDLNTFEQALNKTILAKCFKPAYSFVSIIEKSSYTKQSGDPYQDPDMRKKLFPQIPDDEYICFYPMSKLREGDYNWYQLEKDVRGKMMFDHIKTAKPFTKDVKRIITGAMGLDDYEWGVSLFCHDPLQFKKLIYDTRFDEVSARYGIFGSFYIGHRIDKNELPRFFS